jgi:predicted RNA-binding Zn-ribbon protein involved in translation (DUF1610 family)
MKHDCPHCGVSLKFRLVRSVPLPGQRAFLPEQAVPVCPACGGKLAQNRHWSEGVFAGVIGLMVLVFTNMRSALEPETALWSGSAAIVAAGALLGFFHFRYWRTLQRYKAYVPLHRP